MDGRTFPATQTSHSLSLIIPACNEAAGIGDAIREAQAALSRLTASHEILVVDDGSSDETAAIVAGLAARHPQVRLLRHETNRGYGAALRTGFVAARGQRIAFTDADCQFYLDDLARLLPLADRAHLAAGFRIDRQDPWLRRFFSWGYNRLARLLVGTQVRDCDCALKVFRREVLSDLLPESKGFFVNTEMLARARQRGYQVAEAGVRHRPRIAGHSKVSLLDIPRTLGALLPFWWSRILFPAADGRNETPQAEGRLDNLPHALKPPAVVGELSHGARLPRLDVPVVFLVALFLFFARLGCPLQEPEEPRYAEIPRQMLEAGQWLVPMLHGLPYYDKPPLLYWLIMGSYRLFGVHDWAARLVPATAALLTVLVTYFWGHRVAGRRAGLIAAVILCLSARYVYLGRLLTMNGLLCLWTTAALATAHFASSQRRLRWGWWLASAALAALGLLTKGPVTLVLVMVPLVALQVVEPRLARLRPRDWFSYLGLALALAGPWYVCLALRESQFAGYFFWKQHVLRYLIPFDHARGAWYYLPDLVLGMFPWSVLLVPLVKLLGRRDGAGGSRRPAALGFFLLAALWCFLFFSLAGSKRSGYILPAMPPLALALGTYLDRALSWRGSLPAAASHPWSKLALGLSSLVLTGGVGIAGIAAVAGILRPALAAGLVGGGLLTLAVVRRWGRAHTPERSWAMCGVATFAVLLAGVHLALPGYARRFSIRGQARPLAELTRDHDVAVVSFPRSWDSVSFYLQRNDIRAYGPQERGQLVTELRSHPQTLAFIKGDRSLHDLLHSLPVSIEFVPSGRQGYVRVGWLRRRPETPGAVFASR